VLHAYPPAKVNLTLAVGPRASDGFHPLRSVFARLALADELAVELAPPDAAGDQLTVEGDFPCPVEGNLVLRAFALLRGAVGQPLPALRARLVKHVPLAAGLAGGSSDGAAALELAARAWGVGLAPAVMQELAVELGSDVAFFAHGASVALVEGRGERVTPLPAPKGSAGVLLRLSDEPLATARVYDAFDRLAVESSMAAESTAGLVARLRAGIHSEGLAELAGQLRAANDLWPAAADLMPTLVEARQRLEQSTGQPWLMSGSGPTLFALYPSFEQARRDEQRLSDERLLVTSLATTAARGAT